MKGVLVARLDNMTEKKNAAGPQDSQRVPRLVSPGEDLGDLEGYEVGHGVIAIDGRIRATKNGQTNVNGTTISVEPRRTAYMPRPGDLVIGFVEGCTNNIWFVDIGAPFNAILPMSLGPAKADFGGTRSVIDIGEAILCRVQEVEETHSSVVTMKGMGLRKIRSGAIEVIDPHLLGRLIGKQGQALRQLKEESECRVIAGENGRLWIDGDFEGTLEVRTRLRSMTAEAKAATPGGVA
jgi:exosome complex component RRP4|tara:strand:+ start:1447 stop:2157 length:711 start_codon:yes stop_codon:yes gene_type:complete